MINLVDWFSLMSLDYNNNERSGNLMHTAPLTAETLDSINSVVSFTPKILFMYIWLLYYSIIDL